MFVQLYQGNPFVGSSVFSEVSGTTNVATVHVVGTHIVMFAWLHSKKGVTRCIVGNVGNVGSMKKRRITTAIQNTMTQNPTGRDNEKEINWTIQSSLKKNP